ncbi:MAG: HPr(Ser) kinase/phosphatase [Gammaproteobacteria bacterium]|jgi:HPr kinase/phosphorylase|nr:HPr(Ser) kinase/phosphatase [Gammaproteobacteria bacterium]
MTPSLKIRDFLNQHQLQLQLGFTSRQVGLDREIMLSRQAADTFDAADYFNVIRTSSVVLVGFQESRYIQKLTLEEQTSLFRTLFRGPVCIIICSQDNPLPQAMVQLCERQDIAVLQSALSDSELLDNTRHLLARALAETTTEHGVFLEVYSLGVFITGKSAVGKSELALALISQGHRLIADDVALFSRSVPDTVEGSSPRLLTDFMEVRGLGIVNVRAMFGANSLKRNMPLSLIINMVAMGKKNKTDFDRLGNQQNTRTILGLEFPEITLPVAPGRNLAVLVEAAARNHLLQTEGYDAAQDLIARQNQAIAQGDDVSD